MPVDLNRAPKVPTGAEYEAASADIQRSDNGGFIVSCSPKEKMGGDGGMPAYQPPKKMTFESWESAKAFLDSKFGSGEAMAEEEPAAE